MNSWVAIVIGILLYAAGVVFVAGMTWPVKSSWFAIVASALSWAGLAIILGFVILLVIVNLIVRLTRFLARKLYHFGEWFAGKVVAAMDWILD